jgi:hypothetical protein
MLERKAAIAVAVMFAAINFWPIAAGAADAPMQYPDLKGQWRRSGEGPPRYDPGKPPGRGQQAPLTDEYQAIYNDILANRGVGDKHSDPTYVCLPPGMPRQMNLYEPMEILVTPEITYLLIDHIHDSRRIYTDGRSLPADLEPTFSGYSIGQWIDEDGDGRYDTLVVETRNMKGPRDFDGTGLPLHDDNKTVVKERFYLDKRDPDALHDEITTVDSALKHPWTVTKTYRRSASRQPIWWRESVCAESNPHVTIGHDDYFISADGYLMPVRKNQPAPDLRYFDRLN